jgi:hypothetical protein
MNEIRLPVTIHDTGYKSQIKLDPFHLILVLMALGIIVILVLLKFL